MRTLVVLAVVGLCSATTYQAYNHGYNSGHNHGYNSGHNHDYNSGHSHGYNSGHNSYGGSAQPKWTGPVAATVPAGVGGKVIPVSDTQEVAAARNAFFKVYQNQLASVGGGQRYGAPGYGAPSVTHAAPAVVHAAPAHHHAAHSHSYSPPVYTPTHSYGAPAHGVPHGFSGPVGDTPEVAAAKTQFFQTFKKQAAAAAAAPDDHTYH